MKWLLKQLARWLFGFRTENESVLRQAGPLLLVPNHVSLLDWFFVVVCLEDDWKFVVSRAAAETTWVHRLIALNHRTFPIDITTPYGFKRVAEYLQEGGRLVMFAEGRITRTGSLMKLFEGTGFLMHRTQARIITCYLRGAEKLRLTRHRNRKEWFPRVTAHFSGVMEPPAITDRGGSEARVALTTWLRDRMVGHQFEVEMRWGRKSVLAAVASQARKRPRFPVLQDATFQSLSYRKLMVGADLLAGQWRDRLPGRQRVGVLLPNVNATPMVVLSLWLAERVPAMLNYSTGTTMMLKCAEIAGLKQVITSRVFCERANLDAQPFKEAGLELIYLEDLLPTLSGLSRLWGLAKQVFFPGRKVRDPRDAVAVVLFTSGSEGMPKGVELTHTNLVSNIRQVIAIADIQDEDRFFNALPMFHCFGITAGTLLPLARGIGVFVYPSPLHYRVIPTLFYDRDCTVLISTNTFLNGYARRAHQYDWRRLRYLFAGAEKLQGSTVQTWSERFGVSVMEGYGVTECSPVISVNTLMESRLGSVGKLVPGMEARIEPVHGLDIGGRLLVRGPNVMKGYLNPAANAAFKALDGWYDTGDVARLDRDGFLYLLGRLKRFAKVSGEMVSLLAVEEALSSLIRHRGEDCELVVVSRPDPGKGEVLIAVSNEPSITIAELREALRERGLSNLWVPKELVVVSEIPKLGTGKVNHREVARVVAERGGD